MSLGLVLLGCAEKEVRLSGSREDVRASSTTVASSVPPAGLPAPRNLGSWGHRGAGPDHAAPHVALGRNLRQFWAVSIGTGEGRRTRITADPVSDGLRIFTLDAAATVSAVGRAGRVIWTRDLTPSGERTGEGSGGGLAVAGGTVYVNSGYGTLTAMEATTGRVRWRQDLDAVPSGPPTVRGGLVYLVSRDNRAWAIDTATGRVRWQLDGLPTVTSFANGAGPAVGDSMAIFPFSSGELVGVLRQGGVRLWSSSVSGRRLGRVYANVGDFGGDPVIANGRVYAGTQSGRLVALNLNNGDRLWTAPVGTYGQVWAGARSVWLVTDDARLTRLDARNGQIQWQVRLPYFVDERQRKRKGIHAHYGPLMAGGRLVVASSDGVIRAFDPSTGALASTTGLPSGAATAPIVVDGTLYVVTTDGRLRAYR